MKVARLLCVLLGLTTAGAFHATPVAAFNQLYVASGASDTNNSCLNATTPCATITHAAALAQNNDTINVASGTYTENVNFGTKAINVQKNPASSTSPIIDGSGVGSVLIFSSAAVYVAGLTIQHGNAALGGGIASNGADLVVHGCTFLNNQAVNGGAIYATGGYLDIDSSAFSQNKTIGTDATGSAAASGAAGGALFTVDAPVTIATSTFSANSARGGTGNDANLSGADANGGAIFEKESGNYSFGQPITIATSSFISNTSTGGGGGADATPSSVGGTGGTGWGGAIMLQNPIVAFTSCNFLCNYTHDTIDTSVFSDNKATGGTGGTGTSAGGVGGKAYGGALEVTDNTATTIEISNVTFSGNQAGGGMGGSPRGTGGSASGGSVENFEGYSEFMNVTISGNGVSGGFGGSGSIRPGTFGSARGGGIDTTAPSSSGSTNLSNTIIANNNPDNCGTAFNAATTDHGNNLQYGSDCPATIPSADPVLGMLQNNGGPTMTMALAWTSPAIDHGSNSVCSGTYVNGRDQRLMTRITASDPTCDIGAYEFVLGATAARVTSFHISRHGALLTARWRAPHPVGFAGFLLRQGAHTLTYHLIPVHSSVQYRVTVPDGRRGTVELAVVSIDGRVLSVGGSG